MARIGGISSMGGFWGKFSWRPCLELEVNLFLQASVQEEKQHPLSRAGMYDVARELMPDLRHI